MAAGIGMVTQEFSLVETDDGRRERRAVLGGPRAGRRTTRTGSASWTPWIGWACTSSPTGSCPRLSIGERQRVEIVKALFHDCRVLILDEPTAVLTPQDVRALFATVERLRGAGLGVLFVSHKLREVVEISDRVVGAAPRSAGGARVTSEVRAEAARGLMMGSVTARPTDEERPQRSGAAEDAAPSPPPDRSPGDGLVVLRAGRRHRAEADRSVLDDLEPDRAGRGDRRRRRGQRQRPDRAGRRALRHADRCGTGQIARRRHRRHRRRPVAARLARRRSVGSPRTAGAASWRR